MVSRTQPDAWSVAASVTDPQLPMLTLADLGVLRDVDADGDRVTVTITPTYSGCPAMDEMRADVARELEGAGFTDVDIRIALSPPWTSDWISEEGRRKLARAGIAPPGPAPRHDRTLVNLGPTVRSASCPQCGQSDTQLVSEFSATACRALRRCPGCGEPFEHFKEH